ncbi:uncharacterized protein PHACADRAFT_177643 [Phanerochaete carnosa HHB-10118-sp]|uniref:Uncharacterized protein n=1 Tax=Phanerochaete carnosa (strain HHB-10118-sp) TaxID=650164 RepID=K5VI46_PHACS|nr:uncharacterized protein PHACADRAFT_177643 [Phanerochaete carnosa HHB-10118-sp]EKM50928.1 hypothetical protein PHACADRAFT_177643 [Phanerochaete carnosa HHB-10118-sp]
MVAPLPCMSSVNEHQTPMTSLNSRKHWQASYDTVRLRSSHTLSTKTGRRGPTLTRQLPLTLVLTIDCQTWAS